MKDPVKTGQNKAISAISYRDPSVTEVSRCCKAATKKLTFSTTSVLLRLNVPLSMSIETFTAKKI